MAVRNFRNAGEEVEIWYNKHAEEKRSVQALDDISIRYRKELARTYADGEGASVRSYKLRDLPAYNIFPYVSTHMDNHSNRETIVHSGT